MIKKFVRNIIQFCSKIIDAYVRSMYHEHQIHSDDGREMHEWYVVRGGYLGRSPVDNETEDNKRLESDEK